MEENIIRPVRAHLEHAVACLGVLEVGDLDRNIGQAIDELRTAQRLLEQFRIECQEYAAMRNARPVCPAEHGGKMQDCAAYPACACDFKN